MHNKTVRESGGLYRGGRREDFLYLVFLGSSDGMGLWSTDGMGGKGAINEHMDLLALSGSSRAMDSHARLFGV